MIADEKHNSSAGRGQLRPDPGHLIVTCFEGLFPVRTHVPATALALPHSGSIKPARTDPAAARTCRPVGGIPSGKSYFLVPQSLRPKAVHSQARTSPSNF